MIPLLIRVARGSAHNFAIRVGDWFLALMLECSRLLTTSRPPAHVTAGLLSTNHTPSTFRAMSTACIELDVATLALWGASCSVAFRHDLA